MRCILIIKAVMHHANKNFSASDAVMGRCISTAISLTWTEEQIIDKGNKIVAAVKKIMQEINALV